MKQIVLSALIAALFFSGQVYGADSQEAQATDISNVISFINSLKSENVSYYHGHNIEFFAALTKGQYPVATIVTCSDSRVHTNMFSRNPEGKLFMVRNIGNQLSTAEGSVEYGVHHLRTPVLLFIGHSRCTAIAAVTGNYSQESAAIKRELDTISIGKDLANMDGVKANIHNQVAAAMLKFNDETKDKKLTVVGAVIDFADDMHLGAGRFNIINVDGETDPAELVNLEALITKLRMKVAAGNAESASSAPESKKQTGNSSINSALFGDAP